MLEIKNMKLSEENEMIDDMFCGQDYFAKAYLEQMEGRSEKAIEYYNKFIELNPGNREAYNNLAIIYEREHKYKKALECLAIAIELNPEDDEAYYNMEFIYDAVESCEYMLLKSGRSCEQVRKMLI